LGGNSTGGYKEGKLDEKMVVANFAIPIQYGAVEGKTQEHDEKLYSLIVMCKICTLQILIDQSCRTK